MNDIKKREYFNGKLTVLAIPTSVGAPDGLGDIPHHDLFLDVKGVSERIRFAKLIKSDDGYRIYGDPAALPKFATIPEAGVGECLEYLTEEQLPGLLASVLVDNIPAPELFQHLKILEAFSSEIAEPKYDVGEIVMLDKINPGLWWIEKVVPYIRLNVLKGNHIIAKQGPWHTLEECEGLEGEITLDGKVIGSGFELTETAGVYCGKKLGQADLSRLKPGMGLVWSEEFQTEIVEISFKYRLRGGPDRGETDGYRTAEIEESRIIGKLVPGMNAETVKVV